MRPYRSSALLVALLLAGGCRGEGTGTDPAVSVPTTGEGRYDPEALERQRTDPAWRAWADRDRRTRGAWRGPATVPPAVPETARVERFEHIRAGAVNARPHLPVPRTEGGPSVLHAQILLDRVDFSPGILDGRWGKNTEKAVYWFQYRQRLVPTGVVDGATYERLAAIAGAGEPVVAYEVTDDDVAGPFVSLPEDVYEKAELDCLCYESPVERMSERFHSTPELLEQLNPGVDLEALDAGTRLWVPNVRGRARRQAVPSVARIIISRGGFYTQALDADGNVVFHFPSTLGSRYDPSPAGDFRVATVFHDPHFHYQPELFHDVPDAEPEAMLPAGPNSPVGVVWIALSMPHYGIHGTSEPRTIGYVSSHGCVRLTNWDALELARHTREGTPVEFR